MPRFPGRDGSALESPALLRLGLAALLLAAPALAAAQSVTKYDVPTPPPTDLYAMCVGPDGAIWFGEARTWKVGRINADGTITEYSTPGSPTYQMTAGPDGAIWVANGGIGRLTLDGQFTNFDVPPADNGYYDILDVALGPDGAVWFADSDGERIGRITPAGEFTFYPIPMGITQIEPYAITLGPDGNLWFADHDHDVIGRMTPAGVFTTFLIPGSQPNDLAAGPDGAIWFVGSMVGRVSTSGEVKTFASGGFKITPGHDNDLYFSDIVSLHRMTTDGEITNFDLPVGPSIDDLVAAPDGEIWFTDNVNNEINRLIPAGRRVPIQRPREERPSPRVVPQRPEP